MRRRTVLVAGVCALGCGVGSAARALGSDAVVPLVPGARARLLRHFTPAAGPLERHAARPGAWYALLYLPMTPSWPMQLLLRSTEPGHELRLFALDAVPDEGPSVVHALPLEAEGGRTVRLSIHFMLPPASTAAAMFVLVEQWRIDGEPPAPLWVQLQAHSAPQPASTPWWSTHVSPAASPSGGAAPPPSPLTQSRRGGGTHEVPIFSLPAPPDSGMLR